MPELAGPYVGEEHSCPRCGYDLAGVRPPSPETPVLCPECGLTTSWRAMNDPDRHARRWHLECTDRGVVRAGFLTAVVCLFPVWLWSRVGMEVPVRPGRLLWFAAICLGLTHVAIAFSAGVEAHARVLIAPLTNPIPLVVGKVVPPPAPATPPTVPQLERLDTMLFSASSNGEYTQALLGSSGLETVLETWAAQEQLELPVGEALRWANAARVQGLAIDKTVAAAREERATAAWVRAVLMPYLPGPRPPSGWFHTNWTAVATLTRLGIVMVIVLPLTFLLLRQSLRVARVRPAHLLRAFAYSMPAVVVLAWGSLLLSSVLAQDASTYGGGGNEALSCLALPLVIGTLALAPVWFHWMWFLFTTRYLRLPRAPGVMLVMVLLSFVVAASVCFFAWDRAGILELLDGASG